ncbi:hypothetical protein QTO34_012917 [Cnephaeus nilssonii]|uniref:Uncharacterized protein n=1 Tax=Cnephaeus nilssonii TaxID=3371016 RepID=A0AA40LDM0_CNENI|nr:hypothetical protein QTO34_012917 [Eptesicus nilssonii]
MPGRRPAASDPRPRPLCSRRDPERHVRVKQRGPVLNMLRRLDKIRFRGHKRDDFLDLAESPNASDTECGDDVPLKVPRTSPRDSEELRDPVSTPAPGPDVPLHPLQTRARCGVPTLRARLSVDWGRERPAWSSPAHPPGTGPAPHPSVSLAGGPWSHRAAPFPLPSAGAAAGPPSEWGVAGRLLSGVC